VAHRSTRAADKPDWAAIAHLGEDNPTLHDRARQPGEANTPSHRGSRFATSGTDKLVASGITDSLAFQQRTAETSFVQVGEGASVSEQPLAYSSTAASSTVKQTSSRVHRHGKGTARQGAPIGAVDAKRAAISDRGAAEPGAEYQSRLAAFLKGSWYMQTLRVNRGSIDSRA
jgi:hypothetical protein